MHEELPINGCLTEFVDAASAVDLDQALLLPDHSGNVDF